MENKKLLNYFEKIALSKQEIKEACNNGILPENIEALLISKRDDGFWYPNKKDVEHLAEHGIKYAVPWREKVGDRIDYHKPLYLLTDFYLIISLGYSSNEAKRYQVSTGSGSELRYERNLKLLVIPYEKINKIQLDFKQNFVGGKGPTYAEKDKSVVAGAVVGGLVAGPTGAVVGALANQGKKKNVLVSPGYYYNDASYSLKVQAVDEYDEWVENNVVKVENGKTEFIDKFNQELEEALAKAKEMTIDEKVEKMKSSIAIGKGNQFKKNLIVTGFLVVFCVALVAFLLLMV